MLTAPDVDCAGHGRDSLVSQLTRWRCAQSRFEAGIERTFDAKNLNEGTAWAGHGPEFFFALYALSTPTLVIDDGAGLRWSGSARHELVVRVGRTIEPVGQAAPVSLRRGRSEVRRKAGYACFRACSPISQPGVPSGKLSEKIIHTSKIYDGMKSEYWIYVPAQYDPKTPAALMVFQDGGGYIDRNGNNPASERDRQPDRGEENSGDDLRLYQSGRYCRTRRARRRTTL